MPRRQLVLTLVAVAVAGATGVALASGGPPPPSPGDPPAFTVVATGATQRPVRAPRRRTDSSIERAVHAARARAVPAAVAGARREAVVLARATGLHAGGVVAVRRDVAPPGYWDQESGRFGPAQWCGRLFVGRRTVVRADGTKRRVTRTRYGCQVPKKASVRVTVTFAAQPG